MSRLIDADELIEAINKSTCNWAEHLWKRVVCDVIGNQPTAYDVENVVAELKDNCDIYSVTYYQEKVDVKAVQIDEAIDIVRKGGIE